MKSKNPIIQTVLESHEVQAVVAKVATFVTNYYNEILDKGETPVALVVLNGAMPFAVDMLRMTGIPFRIETIKVKSYDGMEQKDMTVTDLLSRPIRDTDRVLIVEDIVDSGTTLARIKKYLREVYNPKQIVTATLLNRLPGRRDTRHPDAFPEFVGLQVPNDDFMIGYGMDLDGLYRNCDAIRKVLPEEPEA